MSDKPIIHLAGINCTKGVVTNFPLVKGMKMSMTKSAIRGKINLDQRWLERGILALDARQTPDEVAGQVTIHDNDRGWNAADAKLGSYLANYIRKCRRPEGFRLSGRFVQEARNMMQKYCGQLSRIAAQNERVAA